MRITEKFHSIQGEGPLTGVPMYFVRTNRCNLRCSWCDSAYTFTGGHDEPLEGLIAEAANVWEDWICLTGGEPLLQADAPRFVKSVTDSGKHVLIETGGSLSVQPYIGIPHTAIDMDVKTPSSGEADSLRRENIDLLRESDYLKFVIKDVTDYNYSRNFVISLKSVITTIFQPCFGIDARWIVEAVIRDRLPVRVMGQYHKAIWGEIPGV